MISGRIRDFSAPRSHFSRIICSISAEGPTAGGGITGRQLKPGYQKPGRPETIKRVLVIDSDGLSLGRMWAFVARLGFQAGALNPFSINLDAQKTADFVANHNFDLVLVDGRIGPLGGSRSFYGDAVVKILRQAGHAGYLVANSGSPEENERMIDAGADFFIDGKDYFRLPDFFLP